MQTTLLFQYMVLKQVVGKVTLDKVEYLFYNHCCKIKCVL